MLHNLSIIFYDKSAGDWVAYLIVYLPQARSEFLI